jgi:hypothetical protein
MNIMVCIDDTDNLNSPGTGDLAESIAAGITRTRGASCSMISRHQLYIHEDIPYTSHNSSMCFRAVIQTEQLEDIIQFGSTFLEETSAPGSDPGLCVVNVDKLSTPDALITFGTLAKKQVLTKKEAYETAKNLGIHLSEHGGTGNGVIGALAGTGLRLGGNDGRFKGWMHFEGRERIMKAGRLYDSPFVDRVCTREGVCISPDTDIFVDYKVKTVLLDHKATVLVAPAQETGSVSSWRTLKKRELKVY